MRITCKNCSRQREFGKARVSQMIAEYGELDYLMLNFICNECRFKDNHKIDKVLKLKIKKQKERKCQK